VCGSKQDVPVPPATLSKRVGVSETCCHTPTQVCNQKCAHCSGIRSIDFYAFQNRTSNPSSASRQLAERGPYRLPGQQFRAGKDITVSPSTGGSSGLNGYGVAYPKLSPTSIHVVHKKNQFSFCLVGARPSHDRRTTCKRRHLSA
jgi:hypothetical protein